MLVAGLAAAGSLGIPVAKVASAVVAFAGSAPAAASEPEDIDASPGGAP